MSKTFCLVLGTVFIALVVVWLILNPVTGVEPAVAAFNILPAAAFSSIAAFFYFYHAE